MAQLEDVSRWDEAFIAALPTDEQSWLDFKASAWLTSPEFTDKLSHQVSAFANYDGGYLVVGVGARAAGAPVEIDGGVPLIFKKKLRDWLEMTVRQAVEPTLEQLSVALILPGGESSRIQPEHVVVAIHVPPSEAAPHQARDKKYYTRVGSHLNALGHRAVMDIVGRRRHPRTETRLFVRTTQHPEKNSLVCRVENPGRVLARYVLTVIEVPIKIRGHYVVFEDGSFVTNSADGVSCWRMKASNHLNCPLFPGSDLTNTFKFKFTNAMRSGPREDSPLITKTIPKLRFQTFADEMPSASGEFDLAEVTEHIKLL